MKNKWLSEIRSYEELPEPYSTIANLIGVENTLILASKLGGESLYLPRLSTLHRQIRDRRIQEEFTGYNIRQLARKHHISAKRVQQIVKDLKPKRKRNQEQNKNQYQLALFD